MRACRKENLNLILLGEREKSLKNKQRGLISRISSLCSAGDFGFLTRVHASSGS